MMSSRADPAGVARVLAAQRARFDLAAAIAPPAPRLAPVRRPDPSLRAAAPRQSIPPAGASEAIEIVAIVKAVADETGLSVTAMLDRHRRQCLVRARAAAAWVARRTTAHSLPKIGAAIGGRDHTMALYLVTKAEGLRGTDAAFRLLTDRLFAQFEGTSS